MGGSSRRCQAKRAVYPSLYDCDAMKNYPQELQNSFALPDSFILMTTILPAREERQRRAASRI